MKRQRTSANPAKSRLAAVGLSLFLVVDVGLVIFALRPSAPLSLQGVASPVTETRAPATSPRSAALAHQSYTPAPLRRMIVALDGDRAWRSTGGSCAHGGGLVQATTDGGRTWSTGGSPGRGVARIQPLSNDRGFVYAAAGANCGLVELTTTNSARSWTRAGTLRGAWTRSLSDAEVVVTPRTPTARPCGTVQVADLARASAVEATVLCVDGRIRRTLDGGATWFDGGQVPGGLTVSSREENGAFATYIAGSTRDCLGIAIFKATAAATASGPTATTCLPSAGKATPGTVSLSVVGAAGWLLVGDETWLSGADLTTWKRVA